MNILSGDIGGTKTLLQLAAVEGDQINVIDQQRYPSSEYASFDDIVADFLSKHDNIKIHSACFGVAGPVFQVNGGQSACITNLPWQMSTDSLASRLQIDSVTLINDFQAVGYGLEALNDTDFVTLQAGSPITHGNQLVIGAGTGLGVAQRIWDGNHYRVIATEGGHADYAPANRLQLELTDYIIRRFGRCSMEQVLSGPGLINIYSFIAEQHHQLESAACLAIMASDDPAAAIAMAAQTGSDNAAMLALELFVEAYGTQTGNFALCNLALGGVYIAGGIAPKIINQLREEHFITAFRCKGKMTGLMKQIPVHVAINPEIGLLGSQVIARRSINI